ncbi:MAG: arsenite methyltransferase [Chloroflexi bacterium]|nr:arsenite methyltransferase [Chloroflexota bacterium]
MGTKTSAAGEQPENVIHRAVQAHYGAIARSASSGVSSCCKVDNGQPSDCGGAVCCDTASFYDASLLADLPADVTNLSLGCGDPVTIASLQPGEVVLDLGSGGGIDCFMAARQVGPSGHVIGVDMTPDMLDKANAAKARMGVTNVEFRAGQIEALPVEDNSIDVIMSNCVINLSPDKAAVFRESFRVLKPGGRIAISDIVTQGGLPMAPDLQSWAACVAGAIDVNDYTGLMRAAGFEQIEVVDKRADNGTSITPASIFSARIVAHKPA